MKKKTKQGAPWLLWGFFVLVLVLINALWLLPSLQDVGETNSKFRLEVSGRVADNIRMFVDAKTQTLRNTADQLRFEQQNQKALLERALKENREFNSISILEQQGREVLRVSRFDVVLPESLRDKYDNLTFDAVSTKGVFYSSVTRTESLEPVMSVAVPVLFGIDGRKGILVGELNLKQLSSAINRFRFGATGKVYVVDKVGTLIIDPDISLVLRSPNLQDRAIIQAPQKDRSIVYARYRNENNVLVEGSAVFLPSLRWQVIAEQSVAEANISRNRILLLAALSAGLGVILLLLLIINSVKLLRINARLSELLTENYQSAKLLVQKDRELVTTNLELRDRNRELDEIAKMLVRRDLELTRSNERLQELDAMKSQFVSVAAHQLRTPLTGIKWTLFTLLEGNTGKLNVAHKKIASEGYKAAIRLIDLVNDLLDVARLEEGRFGFDFQRQTLLPVIKRVCDKFQKEAAEKGITLSLDFPAPSLPYLLFDEEKIGIALDNLVDNAVKYTPPGGSVAVHVVPKKDVVTITVRDTGIGIPEKQFDKIFSKFFRGENAQLFQTSGTGLGLYVTKNIIDQHKGSISFESKEGEGTAFSFSLPIR